MSDSERPATPPGFWPLFRLFFGISAVTIGGGYVIVPVIQRAVEKRGWVSESDFYDLLARAQSIPGPMALNSALFVGMKLAGPAGFLAALLGVLLPPFAAMIALATVFEVAGDVPAIRGFLDGSFAVVPGLTAALAFNMIKKRKWSIQRGILTVLGAVGLILAGSMAVPLFFGIIALAWLLERRNPC